MAVHLDDPKALIGATVTVTGGTELGVVENVYVDEHTGRLEWAAVHTGRWGSDVSLVPLATAAYEAGTLHLPYDPAQVSSGPHWPPGRALTAADERQLYEHYGIASSGHLPVAQPGLDPAHGPAGPADQDRPSTPESPARTGTPAPRGRAHPHPGGTAGGDPPNGTAGAEMIRSEEERVPPPRPWSPARSGCVSTWSPNTAPSPSRSRTTRSPSNKYRRPATPTRTPPATRQHHPQSNTHRAPNTGPANGST